MSIIVLQCYISFCCTTKGISYKYTHIPSLLSFPPTPPHSNPLGHHRTLSWVPCAIPQLPTSYLFYTWSYIYMSMLFWALLLRRDQRGPYTMKRLLKHSPPNIQTIKRGLIKWIIREYYEPWYTTKLDNFDKKDKFLERYRLPKLTQEEIESLNKSIRSEEIEFVISFSSRSSIATGLKVLCCLFLLLWIFIFFFIYILLKYSRLTMFQVHSKVIQPYIYIYIIFEIIFHYRLL